MYIEELVDYIYAHVCLLDILRGTSLEEVLDKKVELLRGLYAEMADNAA